MPKNNPTPEPIKKNGGTLSHAEPGNVSSVDILEIVTRVATGLEQENVALDAITGETNELASSLKETAAQAVSLTNSSDDSASAINEIAASVEQVTANIAQVATSSSQTSVSIKE